MSFKTTSAFAAIVIALSLTGVANSPVKAQSAESTVMLMSGHPMLKDLKELAPESVVIGRVRGQSGGILSIQFLNPQAVKVNGVEYTNIVMPSPSWHIIPGDDIILAYKDGSWQYIADSMCEMAWISRLKLRNFEEVQRTSIEWGDSQPVGLPPLRQQTAEITPTPRVNPAPTPIRGLW